VDREPALTWFEQQSTRPGPARETVNGRWRSAPGWPLPGATERALALGEGTASYEVIPDVGVAAWNSCAGSLPWGQPADQRFDDPASLTWEWPAAGMTLLGHPRLRLRVTSSAPVAFVSAKLCDVFRDGTSSLLSRGLLNLTHRSSSTAPEPVPVGAAVDVEVELEAMSWQAAPGHLLRLSLAGTDWPNTLAPPEPVTLTFHLAGCSLVLPVAGESLTALPLPAAPPADQSDAADGVTWLVQRDVLAGRTACTVEHGSEYDVDGGSVVEHYTGRVEVDTAAFVQHADATADFTVRWPEATVRARAELTWAAGPADFDVTLSVHTWSDGEPFASRRWSRTIPRDLA
jgi:hypothetical protein